MEKIIINNKWWLIILLILTSCKKPQIYFDISKQKLIECSNYGLKQVTITNDSTDEKGYAIEPPIELKWNEKQSSPTEISLEDLPQSYVIFNGDKKLSKLELMKSSPYKISYHVIGKQDFEIKIWTDKDGKVYKATNENCKNE